MANSIQNNIWKQYFERFDKEANQLGREAKTLKQVSRCFSVRGKDPNTRSTWYPDMQNDARHKSLCNLSKNLDSSKEHKRAAELALLAQSAKRQMADYYR